MAYVRPEPNLGANSMPWARSVNDDIDALKSSFSSLGLNTSNTASQLNTSIGVLADTVSRGAGNTYTKAETDSKDAAVLAVANSAASSASTAQNNANGRVSKGGDTMTGDLYLPNSTAATSGYTISYINGDGRVCRGASSIRYKSLLDNPEPSKLGNLFPPLRQFAMKDDPDQKPILGYIAEELAANADTERFVVYQRSFVAPADEWVDTQVPESIDFIQLLMAQNAALNARVESLEARLAGAGV